MATELLGKAVTISEGSCGLPFRVWDLTVTSQKVWVYAAPGPLSYFDRVSKLHLSGRTISLIWPPQSLKGDRPWLTALWPPGF